MATTMQSPASEWHLTETYKGLITLSVEALKMLALANGGAAVGVLTYLGNLASHSPTSVRLPEIRPALLCYSAGLVATVLAFIAAYLTQLRLYGEERSRHGGEQVHQLHSIGITVGVLLALLAALAFAMGCWKSAGALTSP
jgi:hypothetical protein